MTDQLPPYPEVQPPSRSFWRNLSVVWVVPILALVVALGIAWQAYSDRGALIEIRFENAAGVTSSDTTLRHRDVVIGEVEDVSFSDDLRSVIVHARVETEVLPYLDEDAIFWVVRPEISAQGVSGLSTVVSGVYIAGAWNNEAGSARREFEGRESALFVLPGEQGRILTLNVPEGTQLSGGAPVSYRGIQVGRLEDPVLSEDGQSVTVEVFIQAPHDQRITQATRFWDSSGFSINLGAEGLSLDVESLASLVTGGIQFDEIYANGAPIADDAVFEVYTSEELARASAFDTDPVGDVPLSVQFNRRIRNLSAGTLVVMDGTTIGEVTGTEVRSFDTATGPEQRFVADLLVDAELIGLDAGASDEDVYNYLAAEIENGLRARLASAGLISAETRVEFAVDYAAEPAVLDRTASPSPAVPWVPSAPSSLNATAEGLLDRLAALPFEELLGQTIDTLASVEGLAGDPALRGVPEEAIGLLEDARELIGGETTQAIPVQALAAIEDLRAVTSELRESGLPEALNTVVGQAEAVIASADTVIASAGTVLGSTDSFLGSASEALVPINEAVADLPAIMGNLSTLSQNAAALELEATIDAANAVLASFDAFITAEGMADVPSDLASALAELDAIMTALSETDVVGDLNTALASANTLIGNANTALGPVTEATARLPDIMENISTLSETAAELEVDATIAAANSVLAGFDAFITAEGMTEVPANLASALSELEALMTALSAADVVGTLNSTLTSADTAAASANAAAGALPDLVSQTEAVLGQVNGLLSTYGARSAFMGETMSVLQEITEAARAISRLARTIERNPNSLLTGR